MVISELESKGTVYAQFTDIRDARSAFLELPTSQPGWMVDFVSAKEFTAVLNPAGKLETTDFEGRIVASAYCEGPRRSFELDAVVTLVKDLLQTFGELLAFKVPVATFPTLVIHAEYYDSTEAENALRLSGVRLAVSNSDLNLQRFEKC